VRHADGHWQVIGLHDETAKVRMEPFGAIEIGLTRHLLPI